MVRFADRLRVGVASRVVVLVVVFRFVFVVGFVASVAVILVVGLVASVVVIPVVGLVASVVVIPVVGLVAGELDLGFHLDFDARRGQFRLELVCVVDLGFEFVAVDLHLHLDVDGDVVV